MPETPEQLARIQIDAQLGAAGWAIQDIASLNLHASRGVAVREMQSHGGPADYILFVDGKALGIVEAKKEGTTLSTVAEQSARYTAAMNWIPQRWADPLPFTYESTGIETNFRDQRDPDSRSRPVFAFHTPVHLLELVQQPDTLRARLRQFIEYFDAFLIGLTATPSKATLGFFDRNPRTSSKNSTPSSSPDPDLA